MKLKIEIEREIGPDFIDSIFVGAFEGGIGYWCGESENTYSVKDAEGEQYIISAVLTNFHEEEDEADRTKKIPVTTEDVLAAISGIVNGTNKCRSDIRDSVVSAVLENYAGHIDIEASDVILQFAALKEIVYG